MSSIFKEELDPDFVRKLFKSDEKVLKFIAGIKWENGFVCRKCGNTNYCEGKTPFARRCTKCKTEESATAHTLFHNCKFSVSKAFYIAYNICVLNKEISSYEYADTLDLQQMTCWKFRKKIQECVASKKRKATGLVPLQTLLLTEQ